MCIRDRVVADSGDIESIEQFKPTDTTTNPSLLTAAAGMPQYQPIVDDVLREAKKQLGPNAKDADVANLAFRHLAVAFGKKILAIVPGRVSTEVDARMSYDTAATMKQAHEIIQQYDEAGISQMCIRDRRGLTPTNCRQTSPRGRTACCVMRSPCVTMQANPRGPQTPLTARPAPVHPRSPD